MKNIILTLALLVMNSYYAQSLTLKDFDLNIKTFDSKIYNENKDKSGQYIFYLDNGIKVSQSSYSRGGVTERIIKSGDPYSIERVYYPNGQLHYGGKLFYNFDIGKQNFYDEQGKIIRTNDYDYLYTFSVEHLVKKMREEYGIDLSKVTERQRVDRNHTAPDNKAQPEYRVYLTDLQKDSLKRDGGIIESRTYHIDGSTGNTTIIAERVYMGEEYQKQENSENELVRTYRFYELNGKGEILKITEKKQIGDYTIFTTFRKILEEKVIYQREGYNGSTYIRYKGKSYTEEEWVKFEQAQYEQYALKNNLPIDKDKSKSDPKTAGRFFLDERDSDM